MSPSHQDGVRQNNCNHERVGVIRSELGMFQLCMDCGKRVDLYKCPKCPHHFEKQSELNIHIRLRHRVVDDQRRDD